MKNGKGTTIKGKRKERVYKKLKTIYFLIRERERTQNGDVEIRSEMAGQRGDRWKNKARERHG